MQHYSSTNDSDVSLLTANGNANATSNTTASTDTTKAIAMTSEIEITEIAKEGEKADPSQFELLSMIGQVCLSEIILFPFNVTRRSIKIRDYDTYALTYPSA